MACILNTKTLWSLKQVVLGLAPSWEKLWSGTRGSKYATPAASRHTSSIMNHHSWLKSSWNKLSLASLERITSGADILEHHISSPIYLRFIPRPINPDRHIQTVAKMTSSSQLLASQSFFPVCIILQAHSLLFVKTFRLKPDSCGASRNRWRTRWRKGADLTHISLPSKSCKSKLQVIGRNF